MKYALSSRNTSCTEICLLLCILFAVFECMHSLSIDRMGSSHAVRTPIKYSVKNFKDELRCHCNLPLCVMTGYMCKSSLGTCFSEIVDPLDFSKSRHGCLELLSSEKAAACKNVTTSEMLLSRSQSSQIVCCQEDLCNFNSQQPEARLLHTVLRNRSEFQSPFESNPALQDQSHVTSKDLWLKAATIAVPIAGGFILVLLVLLAIRILRRDRRGSNGPYNGHLNSGTDFQIRRVWGKARQQRQQLSSSLLRKDVQPMLSKNNAAAAQQHRIGRLTMPGSAVYLATLHTKTWRKSPAGLGPIYHV